MYSSTHRSGIWSGWKREATGGREDKGYAGPARACEEKPVPCSALTPSGVMGHGVDHVQITTGSYGYSYSLPEGESQGVLQLCAHSHPDIRIASSAAMSYGE